MARSARSIKRRYDSCLERISGARLAVLTQPKRLGLPHPSSVMLDLITGADLWNSQPLGLGECLRQFALPVRGLLAGNQEPVRPENSSDFDPA
jgi:hypothetical protein